MDGAATPTKDSRAFRLLIGSIATALLLLLLWFTLGGFLEMDRDRARHHWLSTLDSAARKGPVRVVDGEVNWTANRATGGKSVPTFFSGFDLYRQDGRRLRIQCPGEASCPPRGKAGLVLPWQVRVYYLDSPFGRVMLEVRARTGAIVVSRATALADVDRRAAWERAHPFSTRRAWFQLILGGAVLAGLALTVWRDLRREKQQTARSGTPGR